VAAGAAALLPGCAAPPPPPALPGALRPLPPALPTPPATVVRAARLREGDTVGLFAPSGVATAEHLQRALDNLARLGLRARVPRHLLAAHGGYAGTVAQRLDDIDALWRDGDVRALWALRGGAGAASLLPFIDYTRARREPKVVVGYSDTTALLLALRRRAGLVGFHAPLASSTFTSDTVDALRAVLMQPRRETLFTRLEGHRRRAGTELQFRARTLHDGIAEGPLVGGNLSVLSALQGTPFAADWTAAVLFVEEVREPPYRIDRMLAQLDLGPGLARAAAIAAGIFHRCEAPPGEASLTLAETLDQHLGRAGVPAAYGLGFGHVAGQIVLPLGVRARLDAGALTLTLLDAAVD